MISVNDLINDFTAFAPNLLTSLIILITGWIIIKVIKKFINGLFKKTDFDETMESFASKSADIILWTILITIILRSFGLDVSAIVASFGAMGFIIGFALKDTLSNLAAGVFILVYKPFKIGHWVKVSNQLGKVISVSMASTTLNTSNNVKVIIPNSKVWGSSIKNYTASGRLRLILDDDKPIELCIKEGHEVIKALKVIRRLLKEDDKVVDYEPSDVYISGFDRFGTYLSVNPLVRITDFWTMRYELPVKIINSLVKEGIVFKKES